MQKIIAVIIAVIIVLLLIFLGIFIGIGVTKKYFSPTENNSPVTNSENSIHLPNSFTINLCSDGSSAAASRTYNATFVFENRKLVSGIEEFVADINGGIHVDSRCVVDPTTNSWVNDTSNLCHTDNRSTANILTNPIPDLPFLQNEIDKGNIIKPGPTSPLCCHDLVCYELK